VSDLIDTTEMYLRTIYELGEEGVPPLRARIAERLGQSGPTVSQTVGRMERDGLLAVKDDRQIVLSPAGLELAVRVMRKHRLAERLLIDVIGLPFPEVHLEACRWEHVISESVERRLVEVLGRPTASPYGNRIPGLAELGASDAAERRLPSLASLLADAAGEPVRAGVVMLTERAQSDPELLTLLAAAGITPGAEVEAQVVGERLSLRRPDAAGAGCTVELEVADHVFVEA
jgi:DtxR family transcriptional regulator, Mn-dependent transcriptional regulator